MKLRILSLLLFAYLLWPQSNSVIFPPGFPSIGPAVGQISSMTLTGSVSPTTYSSTSTTLQYTYTIQNTGATGLNNLTITDATGTFACGSGTLGTGSSRMCMSSHPVVQADLDGGSVTNQGTATGMSVPTGMMVTSNAVSPPATATQNATITLTKTSNVSTFAMAGDTIIYTFAIQNTGNVTLGTGALNSGPFSISDPTVGNVSPCVNTTLAPTAMASCTLNYSVKAADVTAAQVANTATANVIYKGVTRSSSSSKIVTCPTCGGGPSVDVTDTSVNGGVTGVCAFNGSQNDGPATNGFNHYNISNPATSVQNTALGPIMATLIYASQHGVSTVTINHGNPATCNLNTGFNPSFGGNTSTNIFYKNCMMIDVPLGVKFQGGGSAVTTINDNAGAIPASDPNSLACPAANSPGLTTINLCGWCNFTFGSSNPFPVSSSKYINPIAFGDTILSFITPSDTSAFQPMDMVYVVASCTVTASGSIAPPGCPYGSGQGDCFNGDIGASGCPTQANRVASVGSGTITLQDPMQFNFNAHPFVIDLGPLNSCPGKNCGFVGNRSLQGFTVNIANNHMPMQVLESWGDSMTDVIVNMSPGGGAGGEILFNGAQHWTVTNSQWNWRASANLGGEGLQRSSGHVTWNNLTVQATGGGTLSWLGTAESPENFLYENSTYSQMLGDLPAASIWDFETGGINSQVLNNTFLLAPGHTTISGGSSGQRGLIGGTNPNPITGVMGAIFTGGGSWSGNTVGSNAAPISVASGLAIVYFLNEAQDANHRTVVNDNVFIRATGSSGFGISIQNGGFYDVNRNTSRDPSGGAVNGQGVFSGGSSNCTCTNNHGFGSYGNMASCPGAGGNT